MRRPFTFWRDSIFSKFRDNRRFSEYWQPQIVDDVCVNGCLEQDEFDEQIAEMLADEAVDYGSVWDSGDMPVLKYNDAFKQWRNEEIKAIDELNADGYCLLPWVVLKSLLNDGYASRDVLYYSQGNVGSCMGHADAFAHHSATLTSIARGMPLNYNPFNALYTWCWSKGGSMSGGQSVSAMAAAANKLGHYTIDLVGSVNTSGYTSAKQKQFETDAKKHKSAIMFLDFKGNDLVNEIFEACHAGLAVAFGNSRAVSGATTDSNGVKIAKVSGSWAHATHFAGHRKVNGTRYIGWINSHGNRYGSSSEGEPGDLCWMNDTLVASMASSMPSYGSPYIVIPESTWKSNASVVPMAKIPFPANFKF
jgi:hypothetical protein